MEIINSVMPIVLYILGSVLLISLIVLIFKLIDVADKMNILLDDVNNKVKSLNGIFETVDTFSGIFDFIGNKIISGITSFISKISGKNKERKESVEDE